jgi:hypothetical protein
MYNDQELYRFNFWLQNFLKLNKALETCESDLLVAEKEEHRSS